MVTERADREAIITDPEPVVIVIEFEANPYDEQWFKDVVTNLRKQVDTPAQAPIKPVHLWVGIEGHADRVLALLAEFDKESHDH